MLRRCRCQLDAVVAVFDDEMMRGIVIRDDKDTLHAKRCTPPLRRYSFAAPLFFSCWRCAMPPIAMLTLTLIGTYAVAAT